MRDCLVALSLLLAGWILVTSWLLLHPDEARRIGDCDKAQYAACLKPEAAQEINRTGLEGVSRFSRLGTSWSDRKLDAPLEIITRRLALLAMMGPAVIFFIAGCIACGLIMRSSRLDSGQWRSPLAAFVLKKLAVAGLACIAAFAVLPICLPLWLIYPVTITFALSSGAFVSMLGRV